MTYSIYYVPCTIYYAKQKVDSSGRAPEDCTPISCRTYMFYIHVYVQGPPDKDPLYYILYTI